MRRSFFIMILVTLLVVFSGCRDITVGYLTTDYAGYVPDSMVVKSVLDPVADSVRIGNRIPWQSTSMDGVQGTFPIYYRIRGVHGRGVTPDITAQFGMIRKGVVEVPWNHTVPPGRYLLDVEVSNEGYVRVLDSVFMVVVR